MYAGDDSKETLFAREKVEEKEEMEEEREKLTEDDSEVADEAIDEERPPFFRIGLTPGRMV